MLVPSVVSILLVVKLEVEILFSSFTFHPAVASYVKYPVEFVVTLVVVPMEYLIITIPEPPSPDLKSLLPSPSKSVLAVPFAPPLPPPHKAFCVIPFVLFPSVPPCFPSPFVPTSFSPEPPPPPPNQIVPLSK